MLASTAQLTAVHPLHHAAMVVIEAIAERDCRLWPERDAGMSPLNTDTMTASADGHQFVPVDEGPWNNRAALSELPNCPELRSIGYMHCPPAAGVAVPLEDLPDITPVPPCLLSRRLIRSVLLCRKRCDSGWRIHTSEAAAPGVI